MRKIVIYQLLIVAFLFSCQEVERTPKPKKMLSELEMVELISDLILLDASMSVNIKTLEKVNVYPNEFIFQKYKLDSLELANNLNYYNENRDVNKRIYSQVREKLDSKKSNYDSIKAAKDSIRKAEIEEKRERNRSPKNED